MVEKVSTGTEVAYKIAASLGISSFTKSSKMAACVKARHMRSNGKNGDGDAASCGPERSFGAISAGDCVWLALQFGPRRRRDHKGALG